MLDRDIQDVFNKQVNAELYSSYLYLSMAAYFDSTNLQGMAQWMQVQAQEELGHVMRFYDFVNERKGRVVLAAIKAPPTEWDSPLAAFEDAYKHECFVSGLINDLVDLAHSKRDHGTATFLQWFVTEQMEEEASVDAIVEKLKMVGDHGMGVFMVDAEVGKRVVAATSATP